MSLLCPETPEMSVEVRTLNSLKGEHHHSYFQWQTHGVEEPVMCGQRALGMMIKSPTIIFTCPFSPRSLQGCVLITVDASICWQVLIGCPRQLLSVSGCFYIPHNNRVDEEDLWSSHKAFFSGTRLWQRFLICLQYSDKLSTLCLCSQLMRKSKWGDTIGPRA